MDHLPEISLKANRVVTVPYLVGHPHEYRYDFLGFETYPQRAGWTHQELYEKTDRSEEDFAAFAQSWLYFGLLADMLDLKRENFPNGFEEHLRSRKKSGSSARLCTKRLPRLLKSWKTRCKRLQNSLRSNLQNDWTFALSLRDQYLVMKDSKISFAIEVFLRLRLFKMESELVAHVRLGVAVLIDTFRAIRNDIWTETNQTSESRSLANHAGDPIMVPFNGFTHSLPGSKELKRSLKRVLGWCPSEIQSGWDQATLFWVHQLERGKLPSHERCSSKRCIAFDVDQSYSTMHSQDCQDPSKCQLIHVDISNVKAAIFDDTIPLLSIYISDDNEVSLQVTALERRDFTALSHVWAEGLGNPTANALHACQLRYIKDSISTDQFWLDTLCIPVMSEDYEARNKAIKSMFNIYHSARVVLVIDRTLTLLPADLPSHEVLVRVYLSNWYKRLWTLQEGTAAARSLQFRLLDRSVSLQRLIQECEASPRFWSSSVLHNFAGDLDNMMTIMEKSRSVESAERLIVASQLVCSRSTSHETDEPICLGVMLNLDMERILAAGKFHRMKSFWSSFDRVPLQLLWTTGHGRKLEVPGYRWAPKSLMSIRTMDSGSEVCERTEYGLHLKCSAWSFSTPLETSETSVFYLVKDHGSNDTYVLKLQHLDKRQYHISSDALVIAYEGRIEKSEQYNWIGRGCIGSREGVTTDGRLAIAFQHAVSLKRIRKDKPQAIQNGIKKWGQPMIMHQTHGSGEGQYPPLTIT